MGDVGGKFREGEKNDGEMGGKGVGWIGVVYRVEKNVEGGNGR